MDRSSKAEIDLALEARSGKAPLVWLAARLFVLPLQASSMSGTPLTEAWSAIPLVVARSHYGLLWAIGTVAGVLALIVAQRLTARTTDRVPVIVTLAIAAFAHAATTLRPTHATSPLPRSYMQCI
ncbi:hypothetical protein [Paraburkholderia sp. MM6662-R1]|uniref:hypothetical protein n=1 Tax=Paraburkholderia sp. MM6662-R1 TaxID=2991066 RepID=UPI003D1FB881